MVHMVSNPATQEKVWPYIWFWYVLWFGRSVPKMVTLCADDINWRQTGGHIMAMTGPSLFCLPELTYEDFQCGQALLGQ